MRLQLGVESGPELGDELDLLGVPLGIRKREAALLIFQVLVRECQRRNLDLFYCFIVLLVCFVSLGLLSRVIALFFAVFLHFRLKMTRLGHNRMVVMDLFHAIFVEYLILNKENILVILAVFLLVQVAFAYDGVAEGGRRDSAADEGEFRILFLLRHTSTRLFKILITDLEDLLVLS